MIKYRFDQDIIAKLLQIDYSRLDEKTIRENMERLYIKVTDKTDLGWLPKNRVIFSERTNREKFI